MGQVELNYQKIKLNYNIKNILLYKSKLKIRSLSKSLDNKRTYINFKRLKAHILSQYILALYEIQSHPKMGFFGDSSKFSNVKRNRVNSPFNGLNK